MKREGGREGGRERGREGGREEGREGGSRARTRAYALSSSLPAHGLRLFDRGLSLRLLGGQLLGRQHGITLSGALTVSRWQLTCTAACRCFSHFTYSFSEGRDLLCDVQGVWNAVDGFVLTGDVT